MERFRLLFAVYLILIKDGKILLLRRFNTGWMDGHYTLPSGHVDEGETATHAMVREAREEAGITVRAEDLKMVHAVHRAKERIELFFTAQIWEGEATNAEPEKSDEVAWYPLDNLPENVIPSVRHCVENALAGTTYSEYGW